MRIFKYVSMHSAELILRSKTFRCASPATFNDPFELQVFPKSESIDKDAFIAEVVRQFNEMQAAGERVPLTGMHDKSPIKNLVAIYQAGKHEANDDADFVAYMSKWLGERPLVGGPSAWTRVVHRRLANFVRVCCFTSNECSLLMWSHYADHHRGVILEFETEGDTGLLSRLQPVCYVDDFPPVDGLVELVAQNLGRKLDASKSQQIVQAMLFMKSTEWSYEREWRVLAAAALKPEDTEIYLPFSASSLKVVHLGCRTNQDAAWALVLQAKSINPAVEVFKRSLDPTGFRLLSKLMVSRDEIPVSDEQHEPRSLG